MPTDRGKVFYLELDDATALRIKNYLVDLMYHTEKHGELVGKVTLGGLMRILLQTHPVLAGLPMAMDAKAKARLLAQCKADVEARMLDHVQHMKRRGPKPRAKA